MHPLYLCFDRIHTDGEVCTGDAQFTGNTIHSVLHGVHIFKQDGQPGYVNNNYIVQVFMQILTHLISKSERATLNKMVYN